MLTVADAEAIVDIVSTNAESAKRIKSNIDEVLPASWGISGSIRNWGYVGVNIATFGVYGDPGDSEIADRVCTGIADATSEAINAGVQGKKAGLRRVKKAVTIDRSHWGVAHTATAVVMIDGQTHVFDWHATLDAKNPMLFRRTSDWITDSNGVTFENFHGFD